DAVGAANEADLRAATDGGKTAAFLDRLRVDRKRLAGLASAVRDVAALPDPVGEVVERSVRPNGLRVERVRAPLGVILMIYESRPGVTSDAAALCLRSGNAVLLRGGSEALQTSSVLLEACQRALVAAGLPEDAAQIVPPDRPLVDSRSASAAPPGIGKARVERGVELRADERALRVLGPSAIPAAPDDFGKEFLDLKLAVAVVDGIEAALGHIARYGSRHTEAIITGDARLAERFMNEVDASCVLWNASTRFNDGGELGLGAEIGISTSKLHAYGPMGLRELTCTRYVVRGDGQVRT